MSEKINDGGPAFPDFNNGYARESGMTLRDYFAAKAMQGLTANMEAWALQVDSVALESYAMADAMLRARESK